MGLRRFFRKSISNLMIPFSAFLLPRTRASLIIPSNIRSVPSSAMSACFPIRRRAAPLKKGVLSVSLSNLRSHNLRAFAVVALLAYSRSSANCNLAVFGAEEDNCRSKSSIKPIVKPFHLRVVISLILIIPLRTRTLHHANSRCNELGAIIFIRHSSAIV
jgi:hypothetical protein